MFAAAPRPSQALSEPNEASRDAGGGGGGSGPSLAWIGPAQLRLASPTRPKVALRTHHEPRAETHSPAVFMSPQTRDGRSVSVVSEYRRRDARGETDAARLPQTWAVP